MDINLKPNARTRKGLKRRIFVKKMDLKNRYKKALIAEMRKQGATESDLRLVSDTLVINSMNAGDTPEAVAWALLQ